jgi:hypothetical protein
MPHIVIDTEIVSEIKVDGDWYSVKHGSLQIGEMTWERDGETVQSGLMGFTFEIYGSQAMAVSGPLTAITAVRYTKPL